MYPHQEQLPWFNSRFNSSGSVSSEHRSQSQAPLNPPELYQTSFYAPPSLPQFPSYVPPPVPPPPHAGEEFPSLPPTHRQRHYSQPEPPSVPFSFQTYPTGGAPSHLPPTLDDSLSDLYTLRSIQRQRKREFSNSTSSSSSRNYSQETPSTLSGFAVDSTSQRSAGGGGSYSNRTGNSSGRSTPLSGSFHSSFGDAIQQQSQGNGQSYWNPRPFSASVAPSVASSIASAEPSPPILYGDSVVGAEEARGGLPAAGNYYDYFQPLVRAAALNSAAIDPTSAQDYYTPPPTHQTRHTEHQRSSENGSSSSSNYPFFLPPREFSHFSPSASLPSFTLPDSAPAASTSFAPSAFRPRSTKPLLPILPPTVVGTSSFEEPPSEPDSTNTETSLTHEKLLPILERGLKIRKKHYSELPNPLGVTHPARTRPKSRRTSRSSSLEGGGAENSEEDDDWNGRIWRIVKNASGKKIIGLELKVECEGCEAMGCITGGEANQEEREDKKVARVVLRNLSTRLLGVLTELDQRLQAEEGGCRVGGGERTSRSRTSTAGSNYASASASASPSTSSSVSASTATPGTIANDLTPLSHAIDQFSSASSTLPRLSIPEELGIELNGSTCLICAGLVSPVSSSINQTTATKTPDIRSKEEEVAHQTRERGYEDTLSAAIDRFERLNLDGSSKQIKVEKEEWSEQAQEGGAGNSKDSWKRLVHLEEAKIPEEHLGEVLKCDVCNLACGLSTINYDDPLSLSNSVASTSSGSKTAAANARAFTVEVICARCDALFKACSDCGGGGGRLTPGKWRCRELFPDGRKNCQLSHARNPTLNEITIVVSPVSTLSPSQLDEASAACRKLFFNTRLGTLCRPEFMLRGDGLANNFQQAENLSIDYWGRLEEVLRGDSSADSSMKRYLTITYSQPRPRHPPKSQAKSQAAVTIPSVKEEDFDDEFDLSEPRPAPPRSKQSKGKEAADHAKEGKTVPWAFSIVEVDFSVGVLFFCCVIPWATSGQSFDANSLLIERTNETVKADLAEVNAFRKSRGLPAYPRLKYNFVTSPFKLDSKNSQNLNRRGFYTLDQLEEIEEEGVNRKLFPPYRQIWLPAHYAKAMHTFVRKLENEEDMGGPPPQNAPRKRKKKL